MVTKSHVVTAGNAIGHFCPVGWGLPYEPVGRLFLP